VRPVRLLVVLVGLAALAAAPVARADGDPASDVLIGQNVFLPYSQQVPASDAAELAKAVDAANKAGYPLKVAVIAGRIDLGLVQGLWMKPEQYSRFLGSELRFFFKRNLVIVMPNGFGVSARAGNVDRERRILSTIKPGVGADGLTKSMIEAVQKLSPAAASATSGGGGSGPLDRILIGVGAAVLLVSLVFFGRYLRERGSARRLEPEK
jgi:hypothetical protein